MLCVKVKIFEYSDDHFPRWVKCSLVDADGHEHIFEEKAPVVSAAKFSIDRSMPQVGVVACIVVGRTERDDGRPVVSIDTASPWGVESISGQTRFDVLADQVCELPRDGEDL